VGTAGDLRRQAASGVPVAALIAQHSFQRSMRVALPEQERYNENRQIRLERRSPFYWRVTFDHPPLNIFGPETIPQLNEVITALENDALVKVVVFDSAVEGFFLTHYDFLAKPEATTSLPPSFDSDDHARDMAFDQLAIRGRRRGLPVTYSAGISRSVSLN
jgi:hypothetical protein